MTKKAPMWQIRNLPIVDKSTRLGAKAEQSHHNNRRAAATSLALLWQIKGSLTDDG
jgi:hypothetical protein